MLHWRPGCPGACRARPPQGDPPRPPGIVINIPYALPVCQWTTSPDTELLVALLVDALALGLLPHAPSDAQRLPWRQIN